MIIFGYETVFYFILIFSGRVLIFVVRTITFVDRCLKIIAVKKRQTGQSCLTQQRTTFTSTLQFYNLFC